MLSVLHSIEAISACKDRDRLPRALLGAVVALLGKRAAMAKLAVFARPADGEARLCAHIGSGDAAAAWALWHDLGGAAPLPGAPLVRQLGGRSRAALALHRSALGDDALFLVYEVDAAGAVAHGAEITSLAEIYGNQIRLLDYSELDSLTRLMNRKTFDETFDRLLVAAQAAADEKPHSERRGFAASAVPAWLCVIDIDHFKRVNDSFGHLFGDEVLLRMGKLMGRTFRGGDRLFRFGGEEFVVILNAASEALAATSFDRFRASVETHEFPQVGKVTCSIGFTAVSQRDVATDVVGRADEALYYAKEHGRNRVCCHEALVSNGALARPRVGPAPRADGLDIDALFVRNERRA